MRRLPLTLLSLSLLLVPLSAQQNRLDVVTPAAPELAAFGQHDVGVRTIEVTDRGRVDVLNTKDGGPTARYDRTLTLEIWYPAALAAGQTPGGVYRVITRDPALTVDVHGRAVRDAAPAAGGPFPLIIVSHGYPGNRYLLGHLGENLASKGYVVASIDHRDSTYDDQQAFGSTLYNRPLDQLFVLDALARLGAADASGGLRGLIDASRTGLVGYSMGGYGVVNVVGGGFSPAAVSMRGAPPNGLLAERAAGRLPAVDARIKAAVAIAPWGMQIGVWDAEGLAGIRTPVLFVSGSADDISGYERGTRAIFDGAVNAERYLLTFLHAHHNAAAPMPAPVETFRYSETLKAHPFDHYADPVWDTARMNNILQHFATAFFDLHLRGDAARRAYLDVVPEGANAVFAAAADGRTETAHTYWKGFKRRTAVGLKMEYRRPARR